MCDLWTDYDPDFYLTSKEIEEEESRTPEEREQGAADILESDINRSMGDR